VGGCLTSMFAALVKKMFVTPQATSMWQRVGCCAQRSSDRGSIIFSYFGIFFIKQPV